MTPPVPPYHLESIFTALASAPRASDRAAAAAPDGSPSAPGAASDRAQLLQEHGPAFTLVPDAGAACASLYGVPMEMEPFATAAAAPPVPGVVTPGPLTSASVVRLSVGGAQYTTSLGTLLAVGGSWFEAALRGGDPGVPPPQRGPEGELFIDRDGAPFHYILEYLRAVHHNDVSFSLPNDSRELARVAREALFYRLPGLADHIRRTAIVPQPGARPFYDALYFETGFKPLDPARQETVDELEAAKVAVMQAINAALARRAQEGFAVERFDAGVHTREPGPAHTSNCHAGCSGSGGGGGGDLACPQHNLWFSIILKRVVPLLPMRRPAPPPATPAAAAAPQQAQVAAADQAAPPAAAPAR